MVDPEFSEFQYTYGLTREIENYWPKYIIGTPYFPTQNMEAKIGSDVVIGISQDDIQFAPLFMQYKRSEWMTTGRAAEWDEFDESYFRFDIHSKNQHNTLVELGNGLGKSIYVAPSFHTIDEYSKFHQNQELASNSICFDCGEMREVSDSDHVIIYTVDPLRGAFRSESNRVDPTENVFSVITDMRDTSEVFDDFTSLQRRFRDTKSELDLPQIDREEQTDQELMENPVAWIRKQQQFFFEYFGIAAFFIIGNGAYEKPGTSTTLLL